MENLGWLDTKVATAPFKYINDAYIFHTGTYKLLLCSLWQIA